MSQILPIKTIKDFILIIILYFIIITPLFTLMDQSVLL